MVTFSPPEIAKQLGCSREKVAGWIDRGELQAINVSDSDRPRWRVSQEALEEFLKGRMNFQPKPRRIMRPAFNVIEYFK